MEAILSSRVSKCANSADVLCYIHCFGMQTILLCNDVADRLTVGCHHLLQYIQSNSLRLPLFTAPDPLAIMLFSSAWLRSTAHGEKTLADQGHREILLLYNEQEKAVDEIAEGLRARGLPTSSFRRDVSFGSEFAKIEEEEVKLQDARLILILLGSVGWSSSQRVLAQRAIALNKRIVPVLVGHPPAEAIDDLDGLFRRLRWVDLTQGGGAFDQMILSLRTLLDEGETDHGTPRFDEIINTLVDESDADRAALLDRVIRQDIADRDGLAARIRRSIRDDFGPSQESQFATAVRDPKRFASTRSWMLSVLIWLEPFSSESAALILEHIDPEHEPDRTVRFWTLAGIIQRNLPYRKDAVERARADSAAEISGLASIAADPDSATLHLAFREALRSPSFETAWNVLRVLRVFPVPALASDVVDQLDRSADGKPLAYDALFALAAPDMARAALPVLVERPGVRRLAELVIREARSATPISRAAFARLLSIFEPDAVRKALRAAAGEGDGPLVRRLLADIAEENQESAFEPLIAGYASDTIDIANDDIGISQDVETLASVMLAREVVPPLAIGMFGEWGSGKSFFMRSIAASVERIAERAKDQGSGQFCSDIVQIHFNAWHYVDTSLWASLVSHLLDGMSSHLAPVTDASVTEASLTRELASVRKEMAAAEAERARAADQLRASSQALHATILERERREVRLRDLRAGDLLALLKNDPTLKTEVEGALRQVGAPAALESITELNRVVDESYSAGGRAAALVASIFNSNNVLPAIVGIVVLFLAPPAVAWFVEHFITPRAAALSALAAQVTVVAGSISMVLRRALDHAKTGLDALSKAKRKIDEQLAAKRATPSPEEQTLEKELAEAKASEKAAAERVGIVSARAKALEDRVAAMQQSQSLGYFVTERSRSDDYSRHLGLISVVRKDFEGLVQRLRAGQADSTRRVDRIILYIDDVDRCPSHIVVDILQAVHLLLAYELFVVVVSVDPRWLLHSLEATYSHLKLDELAGGSGATSHDYLDKIFQIPFSVRPMNDLAFGRMMRRLLAPSTAIVNDGAANSGSHNGGSPEAPSKVLETDPAPPVTTHEADDTPRDLKVLARAIAISEAETAFAESLHMLLVTPRSAKRFSNVYRLLKASVPSRDLVTFEGTTVVPGDFQLPMLLLAALIGDSRSSAALFPQFLSEAVLDRPQWWKQAAEAPMDSKDAERLRLQIAAIAEGGKFPHRVLLLREWLPRVARFSFLTARMFLDAR